MNTYESTETAALDRDDPLHLEQLAPPPLPEDRASLDSEATTRERFDAADGPSSNPGAPKKGGRRRQLFAGGLIVPVALAIGIYYCEDVAPYESTDDAFIEAHVTPVAPQVAGRVTALFATDNQWVKAGDILLEIDPSDFRAQLDQATASLASAKSRLAQAKAEFQVALARVDQEKASVIAAQADAKQAGADYRRDQAVGDLGVAASQLDLADTKARASSAQVDAARNKELAAEAQAALDQASIQTAAAEVQRSEAAVRLAELNLSYTQIKAPEAGYITHRTVEPGAYVQPGQALLAVVPRQVWVVANFKETQLAHLRPGQPVTVRVDAYPQIEFSGHVDSIQAGTGPRFSLLPPENASGNYVKVVQRVPVKIVIDNPSRANVVLGPGMSVVPEVKVN